MLGLKLSNKTVVGHRPPRRQFLNMREVSPAEYTLVQSRAQSSWFTKLKSMLRERTPTVDERPEKAPPRTLAVLKDPEVHSFSETLESQRTVCTVLQRAAWSDCTLPSATADPAWRLDMNVEFQEELEDKGSTHLKHVLKNTISRKWRLHIAIALAAPMLWVQLTSWLAALYDLSLIHI